MSHTMLFSLTALLALVPASLFPYRLVGHGAVGGPTPIFWATLGVALCGPLAWAYVQVGDAWNAGLSTALWVMIATCMALFTGLAVVTRVAWRLAPLLLPYLLAVAMLATVAQGQPEPSLRGGAPGTWIVVHIVISVVTYALLTLAAVASLSAFLQERALKAKRPTPLTRFLPSVAESDRMQVRLLMGSEAVLGLGLATGMAVMHFEQGTLLRADHKTLLTLASFLVIGGLLLVHARTGMRGRAAARVVLIAYLLLTLGYLGVKFVTGSLIGAR